MGDHSSFHVQLREHLFRRRWTDHDLSKALQASNGHHATASLSGCGELAVALEAILAGRLAPTEALGELIADLLIGTPDQLTPDGLRDREELIGAAYVAECHGRRQQLPYTFGVVDDWRQSNLAPTVDESQTRQQRVEEQRRKRLLRRLVELEEKQAKRRARRAARRRSHASSSSPNGKPKVRRKATGLQADQLQRVLASRWDEAAQASLAFLPEVARRDDEPAPESFVDVVRHSYTAGHQFGQFIEALLTAWRPKRRPRRGRWARRMSPEQLGSLIGQGNRERYGSDAEKQAWFRRHQGPAVTGNALRNYLSGKRGRPLSECVRKMVWAFVPAGDIQLLVEQKLWRMANGQYPVHPGSVDTLIGILNSKWDDPRIQRKILKQYLAAGRQVEGAQAVSVKLGKNPAAFKALVDRSGVLLSPLVNPKTKRVVADISRILPETGAVQTSVDFALATGARNSTMRALVDYSGIPITRISELTGIHESLFQQWMREGNQRIEDRDRAARIVNLLNPPELARWPITYEQVVQQNEALIKMLTRDCGSLDEALASARAGHVPEVYGLNAEGRKTYRAARLLRQVFGRNSLTNLSGPEVGRLLAARGLGDEQTFKHLREGVRDGGKKSARRATLEQARFLASVAEEALGGMTPQQHKQLVELIACVELDPLGNCPSPAQLLRRVNDPASAYTIREMCREMTRRRGGLIRFSGEIGISPQSLRHFLWHENHFVHHRVARRIAEYGMGFDPEGEEHRQFVILCTAAWSKGKKRIPFRLSDIFTDYHRRLRDAKRLEEVRKIRAETMGAILSQAALSPRELAGKLGVSQAVVAGWTSPRVGHFTSAKAMERFVRLVGYEAEQIEFLREAFGPAATACALDGRGAESF